MAAAFLFPKPRNFKAGRFRLVSTSNNVPARDDLQSVILRGMPGSSMPPWRHLSQAERDALVDEVMRLRRTGAKEFYVAELKEQEELTDEQIAADDVQQEIQEYVDRFSTPGESTVVPQIGEPTSEGLAAGREIYVKFGCQQCHGETGKGDGVQKMIDDEGYATAPRDFTFGIFKGGDDPASLYRRIAYGMPGTPMPSSQQMTPAQMIDLVHFVRSMSTDEQRKAAVLNREQIRVILADSIPTSSPDADWSQVPEVAVRVTPLWWRNSADPVLHVQAVHDGTMIAVRISWSDKTADRHAASSDGFEDGVAMEVYRGDREPFLGMGASDSPIDLWYWDADRQGTPRGLEDLYPNSVVDLYPFSETVAASAELDRYGARMADQPDISLPARASGNQIVPPNTASGGSSLAAAGSGSTTFRLPRSQHVQAIGYWQDGRWSVVMTRPLMLRSADDGVSLTPGSRASVAFAVWNGSEHERDGRKLISIWQDMVLQD
jgi:mono/diheme cytochrome c family protein